MSPTDPHNPDAGNPTNAEPQHRRTGAPAHPNTAEPQHWRTGEPAHRRTERGFTLLEVLIAMSIIAYAVVGLLGLQAKNIKAVARGQNLTRATLLARQEISKIQYEVLQGGLESLGNTSGDYGRNYPGFRFEREVISTGLDSMREVIVRVIFDERNPHACELIYFVRDPAL